MAKILVIDDHASNRELLVALLSREGHQILEADGGDQGLALALAERPQLVITDIVMPTMDGYEFVERLRAALGECAPPVIFYSASYLERESRALAQGCGVRFVITKPCKLEMILKAVDAALHTGGEAPARLGEETVGLASQFLPEKPLNGIDQLQATRERMGAVLDIALILMAESDPARLLEKCCNAARKIIGSKYAHAGLLGEDGKTVKHFAVSGMDREEGARCAPSLICGGPLHLALGERRLVNLHTPACNPVALGFYLEHPPIHSFLAVRIQTSAGVCGWLAFANKLGRDEFDEEEERIVLSLASQLAVTHENARLYEQISQHAAKLQVEITGRTRVEVALIKLRKAVDTSGEVIFMTDREGVFTFVNPEFTRLYGYTAEEMVGNATPRVLKSGKTSPEEYATFWKSILDKRVTKGEWVNKTKDGRLVTMEESANPILGENGDVTGFLSIQRNITERKQAEKVLQASEERFRLLVGQVKDYAILMLDPEGRVMSWNEGAQRIKGYGAEEIIGRHFSCFYTKEDIALQLPKKELLGAAQEGRFEDEGWRVRKDGSRFWANVIITALRDEKGNLRGFSKVTRDITERKQLELQLLHAQKMEAVGRLAGGVAHDFNNLLTIINGYSEMMLDDLEAQDPKRSNLQEIKKAGERAAALTRQLLAFSRQQVLEPRVLDLNAAVADMDKMLRRLIGEDIDLVTSHGAELGQVKADPGQIEQVIMNLAVNARDAMPKGGKLTIETSNVDLDENYSQRHVQVAPGSFVMVAVTDTGCGMDQETQAKIFEPFFTTKEIGKGTGLGLATVYGIVKQSGGFIWVYSEIGRGTTFKIYLPRVQEVPATVEPSIARPAPDRGSETILVVEDEESLRTLVRTVLRANGYLVLEASRGEEALQICKHQDGIIHLMLTDMVMPQMSGRELATRVARVRPETKVLFMSGYTDNAVVHQGGLDEGTPFIQKPFTPDTLTRKVREVLAA